MTRFAPLFILILCTAGCFFSEEEKPDNSEINQDSKTDTVSIIDPVSLDTIIYIIKTPDDTISTIVIPYIPDTVTVPDTLTVIENSTGDTLIYIIIPPNDTLSTERRPFIQDPEKIDTVVYIDPESSDTTIYIIRLPDDTLSTELRPFIQAIDSATVLAWMEAALPAIWSTAFQVMQGVDGDSTYFDSLWIRPDTLGAEILAYPHGLSHEVRVILFSTKNFNQMTKSFHRTWGESVSMEHFPAIGLTNSQGSMVAAGNTVIEGKVLLAAGSLRRKQFGDISFHGDISLAETIHESPLWATLPVTFYSVTDWIVNREDDFSNASTGKDLEHPHRTAMEIVEANLDFTSEDCMNRRILILGEAVFAGNSLINNCEIWAEKITLGGTVTVQNSLLYSRSVMELKDTPNLEGQFIARDSMLVTMSSTHTGMPVFYVSGWYSNQGYSGRMRISRANTKGIFISGANDLPQRYYEVNLDFSDSSAVEGILFTNGVAKIEGTVSGSVIVHNLRFYYEPTIYTGHIFNSRLIGPDPSEDLLMPPIFDGISSPAWISEPVESAIF